MNDEKLGIKPIESWDGELVNLINANKVGNESSIARQYKMAEKMLELEQQNKEMKQVIIDDCIRSDDVFEEFPEKDFDKRLYHIKIGVIEKIIGKTWAEIKELMNDR